MRLEKVPPIRVSIRAPEDKTFRVEGVVRLTVKIGVHKPTADFGVPPKLATIMIPGTAFIDKEIMRIETNNGQIGPRDGCAVAIVERFED